MTLTLLQLVLKHQEKDLCFEFNEYKVDKANSLFSVNDYILRGEIENGNFLNSQVNSSFETYKFGDEYRFQIQGNIDGPFSTLTELTFQIFETLKSTVANISTV